MVVRILLLLMMQMINNGAVVRVGLMIAFVVVERQHFDDGK
jgi:hypothetical protein